MKIHYLREWLNENNKVVSADILCNGNGVFGVSLKKNYKVTLDKKLVTCKKCLNNLKRRGLLK